MRFKITDIDNEYFFQIPKSLLTQKNYRGLSSNAKIVYAILKDRMSLSRKNDWKDENGDIFLIYRQNNIAEILGVSVSTISRAIDQLEEYGLVEVVQQGLNRPNKLYINKIDVIADEANIQDIDMLFMDGNNSDNAVQNKMSNSKADEIRSCIPANQELHSCKSRLADTKIRTCIPANQDLQIRESGFAPVQTSKNKENNNNDSKNKENDNNNNESNMVAVNVENTIGDTYVNLVQRLCKFGVEEELAIKLICKYGLNSVEKQLNVLKFKKKVNNRVGWLISALKDNYIQNPSVSHDSAAVTVDNGRSFFIPLAMESAECAASCAEAACTINEESPFYQSYLRMIKKKPSSEPSSEM